MGIQFFQTIEASAFDRVVFDVAIAILDDAIFLWVTRPRWQWHKAPMTGKSSVEFRNIRIIKTSADNRRFQIVVPQYFGDSPFYCNPAGAESIRNCVMQALDASWSRKNRWKILARDITERFTWERTAELTIKAYERVLGAGYGRKKKPAPAKADG